MAHKCALNVNSSLLLLERMRWLGSFTGSMDMNLSKPQEIVEDRGAWVCYSHGVIKSRT